MRTAPAPGAGVRRSAPAAEPRRERRRRGATAVAGRRWGAARRRRSTTGDLRPRAAGRRVALPAPAGIAAGGNEARSMGYPRRRVGPAARHRENSERAMKYLKELRDELAPQDSANRQRRLVD